MNKKIDILVRMQEFDDRIGVELATIDNLPKELNELKEAVVSTQAESDLAKGEKTANTAEQKAKELEIKANQENIDKYANQLLSAKTNKEYKALNNEIATLKQKNSDIDEAILKLIDEETAHKANVKAKDAQKKSAAHELKGSEADIHAQIKFAQEKVESLKAERNEIAMELPKALIKRYGMMIKHKARQAVVFNEKGACSGCGFQIRPQLVIEIEKKSTIIYCENCGRIITSAASE